MLSRPLPVSPLRSPPGRRLPRAALTGRCPSGRRGPAREGLPEPPAMPAQVSRSGAAAACPARLPAPPLPRPGRAAEVPRSRERRRGGPGSEAVHETGSPGSARRLRAVPRGPGSARSAGRSGGGSAGEARGRPAVCAWGAGRLGSPWQMSRCLAVLPESRKVPIVSPWPAVRCPAPGQRFGRRSGVSQVCRDSAAPLRAPERLRCAGKRTRDSSEGVWKCF